MSLVSAARAGPGGQTLGPPTNSPHLPHSPPPLSPLSPSPPPRSPAPGRNQEPRGQDLRGAKLPNPGRTRAEEGTLGRDTDCCPRGEEEPLCPGACGRKWEDPRASQTCGPSNGGKWSWGPPWTPRESPKAVSQRCQATRNRKLPFIFTDRLNYNLYSSHIPEGEMNKQEP